MHSHSLFEKSSLLRAGQVAGSVVDGASLALAGSPRVADFCDVVEFRADALLQHLPRVLGAMCACPVPALLTVRSAGEAGSGGLTSRAQRDEIFTILLPGAAFYDLEISSLADFPGLIRQASQSGIPLIASFHDFSGTPGRATLETLIARARDAGASAVKFATTLRNSADLAVLAALQESAAMPLSTMGMGPLGRVSRLLLASLGSVLNYGYLDHPTIPGQWPAQRLRTLIRELRGEESATPPPQS